MKLIKIIALLTIVVLSSVKGFPEFPITTDQSYQCCPSIYGDIVVWTDKRNGSWDVYGVNLLTGEEFPVATGPSQHWYQAIYGDIVVWEDDRNGNNDIYGYNLLTGEEFQITTDPSDQHAPAIYNNIVVWTDERNGNPDIYGCNFSELEWAPCTTPPLKPPATELPSDTIDFQPSPATYSLIFALGIAVVCVLLMIIGREEEFNPLVEGRKL